MLNLGELFQKMVSSVTSGMRSFTSPSDPIGNRGGGTDSARRFSNAIDRAQEARSRNYGMETIDLDDRTPEPDMWSPSGPSSQSEVTASAEEREEERMLKSGVKPEKQKPVWSQFNTPEEVRSGLEKAGPDKVNKLLNKTLGRIRDILRAPVFEETAQQDAARLLNRAIDIVQMGPGINENNMRGFKQCVNGFCKRELAQLEYNLNDPDYHLLRQEASERSVERVVDILSRTSSEVDRKHLIDFKKLNRKFNNKPVDSVLGEGGVKEFWEQAPKKFVVDFFDAELVKLTEMVDHKSRDQQEAERILSVLKAILEVREQDIHPVAELQLDRVAKVIESKDIIRPEISPSTYRADAPSRVRPDDLTIVAQPQRELAGMVR